MCAEGSYCLPTHLMKTWPTVQMPTQSSYRLLGLVETDVTGPTSPYTLLAALLVVHVILCTLFYRPVPLFPLQLVLYAVSLCMRGGRFRRCRPADESLRSS